MKLTSTQVNKVAQLASLPLDQSQSEKYATQLTAILDYIDQLNSIETESVEPTFNVSPNKNVLAADEINKSLSQEEALANATQSRDGAFVTEGVFNDE